MYILNRWSKILKPEWKHGHIWEIRILVRKKKKKSPWLIWVPSEVDPKARVWEVAIWQVISENIGRRLGIGRNEARKGKHKVKGKFSSHWDKPLGQTRTLGSL